MNYRNKPINCKTTHKLRQMIKALDRFEAHLNSIDENELKIMSNLIDKNTSYDHPQFFEVSELKQALKKTIDQWW